MIRREFLTPLGGATAAWPLAAHAQEGERIRRVGVLMNGSESDPVRIGADAAELVGMLVLLWFDLAERISAYDFIVGAAKQRQRDGEAECPGGLEVENQLDFRGLLDRTVGADPLLLGRSARRSTTAIASITCFNISRLGDQLQRKTIARSALGATKHRQSTLGGRCGPL